MHPLKNILPNKLVDRVTQHAGQGGTCVARGPVGSDQNHGIKAVLDDGTEAGLAFSQACIFRCQALLEFATFHLPQLFGLAFDVFGLLEEFHEAAHLGLQDDRHDRLLQVVHGSQRIRLLHRQTIVAVGGEKDDRCVARPFPAPDAFGRFKAVQTMHLDVEQDHRKIVFLHEPKGLLARSGLEKAVSEVVENYFQRPEIGRLVVHEQNGGLGVHAFPSRQGRQVRKAGHSVPPVEDDEFLSCVDDSGRHGPKEERPQRSFYLKLRQREAASGRSIFRAGPRSGKLTYQFGEPAFLPYKPEAPAKEAVLLRWRLRLLCSTIIHGSCVASSATPGPRG